MQSREAIYGALFALLAATAGIKTSSRKLKHWESVSSPDQPALFLVQRRESSRIATKLPTIWTFHADIVLYGTNGGQDTDIVPMSILNPIVDAIVTVLVPSVVPNEQTLGGLVERCRIDGDILTDEGVLGDQAIVVIPVTILVPQ